MVLFKSRMRDWWSDAICTTKWHGAGKKKREMGENTDQSLMHLVSRLFKDKYVSERAEEAFEAAATPAKVLVITASCVPHSANFNPYNGNVHLVFRLQAVGNEILRV